MDRKAYFGKDNITPDFLRSAEKTAENSIHKSSEINNKTAQETALTSEKSSNHFNYTGRGKTLAESLKKSKNRNRLGSLKKSTPAFLVGSFILAIIFFMFTMVGNLGNQIETLITRATDTMFGSYSENSIRVTEELLAGKRGEFPEYFKGRLEAQGIKVANASPGYSLDWSGLPISAGTFRDTYSNDIHFREAFTKAKRGRTSNFFDMSANFAFTKLGISRNLYRKYRQTGDSTSDAKAHKKIESDLFDNSSHSSLNTVTERQKTEDGKPVTDKNGNPVNERVQSGENITNSQGGNSKVKARGYLMDIAGRVADTTSLTCAALKVANMISVSVAVAEVYQSINYFLSKAENFSKTKAGEGNYAAQNYVLNFLNEPTTATYTDAQTGEEKRITGAPIEAEGFANVLAGASPNLSKTKNYSVESAFMTSGFAIGLTAANHKICGGLRAVGATISVAIGLFSGGIFKSIATLAKSTVINFAMQQGIASILSALIPKIATSLFENTASSLMGIPAGETFVKGAATGNKKVARSSSGQLLASREVATAYANESKIANLKESELNRKDRSPLDASSPDTFLGQIITKVGAITTGNSLIRSLSTTSHIVGSSFANLIGSASLKTFANSISDPKYTANYDLAGTDYSTVYSDEETCKNLTEIGAACGMYGEEITATHPDFMKISSDDPKYQSVLSKNVRKKLDGTYEVIPNSLLANKTMYCDERDSPFGVYDANIANAFQTSFGFADHIPILNDVVDLVNAVEEMDPETEGWARGSFCVMNPKTNPHYEEILYLQHFTEDQRIATQLKLKETVREDGSVKSPVLAYKEAWYEKNPIDTSEAGLLARYTGSLKSVAENFLALAKYYHYLANYHPPVEPKKPSQPHFKNSPLKELLAFVLIKPEFSDLRSRSFAV
jgi:hypothetical protein